MFQRSSRIQSRIYYMIPNKSSELHGTFGNRDNPNDVSGSIKEGRVRLVAGKTDISYDLIIISTMSYACPFRGGYSQWCPPGLHFCQRRWTCEVRSNNAVVVRLNLGFSRFSLRGPAQAKGEFLLLCIAHNFKKLAQWQGSRRILRAFCSCLSSIIAPTCPLKTNFRTLRSSGRKNQLAASFT
jgi:hypothetical protein